MIIKLTFQDNDFTQILQTYLECYFLMYKTEKFYSDNSPEGLKEFKRLSTLSDHLFKKIHSDSKLTKQEKEELYNLLKEDLTCWIEHKAGFEEDNRKLTSQEINYCLENLQIEFFNKIGSQCENGESIYYFCAQGKTLIM